VNNADPRYSTLITGIPGHRIEDVKLNHIRILYVGGGTREQAAIVPPEGETEYPEPARFGIMPAYGFFIRHVEGIEFNDVEVNFLKDDLRPPFMLQDVTSADFNHVKAQHATETPTFVLKDVDRFRTFHSDSFTDTSLDHVKDKSL
jgi:hypothetical protein